MIERIEHKSLFQGKTHREVMIKNLHAEEIINDVLESNRKKSSPEGILYLIFNFK